MPRRQASWALYNVGEEQFERALRSAARHMGDQLEPTDAGRPGHPAYRLADLGMLLRVSPFPMLRNATVILERLDGRPIAPAEAAPFIAALKRRLDSTATLPGTMAACLLLIGTVMLSAPLLMMARHMDDIVQVVRGLFA